MSIVHVALDIPLVEHFDFRVPEGLEIADGALVVVPFGRARKVGVVVGRSARSDVPAERLKAVESVVEDVAPFQPAELELFEFW